MPHPIAIAMKEYDLAIENAKEEMFDLATQVRAEVDPAAMKKLLVAMRASLARINALAS